MIKVIVDTNIFVSGTLWKGAPHKVLDLWFEGKFKLVVSVEIVNEYEAVLSKLLNHQQDLVGRILETVRMYSEYVQPVKLPKPICRDPNDEIFLEAALAGKVDYIISGDKDLLVLNNIVNLKIINSRQFLDAIGSLGKS